jgi:hypothetical protein
MSQPNEPRFEDDFDCDTDPPEQYEWQPYTPTLEDIAIEGGHRYAQSTLNRALYSEFKEAYKAGFLDGFAHRLTNNTGE